MASRTPSGVVWRDDQLRLYGICIALLFLLLAARLVQLQVIGRDKHRIRSIGNVIQDFSTPAPRGDIFDRAGRPMAKNKQVFKLLYVRPDNLEMFLPRTAAEKSEYESGGQAWPYLHRETGESLHEIHQLGAYLGLTYMQLMERCEREARRSYGNVPITLVDSLTYPQVVFIEENRDKYPRLLIDEYAFQRVYPLGPAAAHLIGYTGRMGATDAGTLRALGYPPDETVGKDGVERTYESLLHGRPGVRYIRLNRTGLGVDFLRVNPSDRSSTQYQISPVKGSDIYLTIDSGLQAKASEVIAGRRGAIVVSALMPGHEGEILALASGPGYDPARIRESDYYARLNADETGLPLVNRAIQLPRHPGSTFKIVSLYSALDTGVFTPGSGFYCPGKLKIGNRDFKCHHEAGHQGLDLMQGFAESCDVVFYNIGLKLPNQPNNLKEYALRFGYGEATGLELAGEQSGVVPDESYKRRIMMQYPNSQETDLRWYDGDSANYAIGQGFLTATPMQVLWSAGITAWDGESWPPSLLYGKQADHRLVRTPDPRPKRLALDSKTLALVRQAMRAAVTTGTCSALNIRGLDVCAKSGTAETGKRGEADDSWVVGFYPYQAPRYAFVAFFQNGGSSGEAAIPAMKQILLYMKDKEPIPPGAPPADL